MRRMPCWPVNGWPIRYEHTPQSGFVPIKGPFQFDASLPCCPHRPRTHQTFNYFPLCFFFFFYFVTNWYSLILKFLVKHHSLVSFSFFCQTDSSNLQYYFFTPQNCLCSVKRTTKIKFPTISTVDNSPHRSLYLHKPPRSPPIHCFWQQMFGFVLHNSWKVIEENTI